MAYSWRRRLAAFFLALTATIPAFGQCADWRPKAGLFGSALVSASTVWDPDGAGPQAPLLVAAGGFSNVDSFEGPIRSNIAAWDGTSWLDLGAGIGNGISGHVNDIIVLNGDLIVAGNFTMAGGTPVSNIARWNGTSWQGLGTGTNGEVFALCLPNNGGLIVGGNFTTAGGVAASNIARWNNATQTWSALGAGVTGSVNALATLLSGDIIAGGGLTAAAGGTVNRIARWNGSAWFNMNGGVLGNQNGSFISALHVRPNGDLIVGGQFIQAGPVPVNNVAKWTIGGGGVWSGMTGGMFGGDAPFVGSFTEFNGELIAGGRFLIAGDFTCNNIARWTGSNWAPLQNGIPNDVSNYVLTLRPYNSELFVAGSFPAYNGSNVARSTARWTGAAWVGMPGFIAPRNMFHYDFETYNGKLILAGQYACLNPNAPHYSRHLIAWDGQTATEMGNPNDFVYSVCAAPGPLGTTDLVAVGAFSTIGGANALRVARFSPIGNTWQPMGAGFNNNAFSVMHNSIDGMTYIGGSFTASGATTLNNIARWNGSSWQPVGTGLNSSAHAMKIFNGQLYVGGFFTTAGGVSTGGLARWTGTTWQTVGGFFNGSVDALEVFQNKLIVAGNFPGISNSPSIAAYDGTVYTTLGTGGARLGNGTQARVQALAVFNNTLVAGGTFASMGGVPCDFIARWNGSSWSEVGNGVQSQVRCLHSYNNELQVGGDFALVNNNTVLSPMWARYSDTGVPFAALNPVSQLVGCTGNTSFTAQAALGYGTVTYQWRKNGVNVVDGPTGTGSILAGAGTTTLSVTNVGGLDAGSYDCVMTNSCGSAPSAAADLNVAGGTPPNITQQPSPQRGCPDGNATFQILVTSLGTPSFQWRKNGTPLVNQPGHIQGAATGTLQISAMTAADVGSYDCVVTLNCGVAISNAAALTFCQANCDCSTGTPLLTPNDFACFINAYAANSAAANCDGSSGVPLLTPNDFACFINAYANGCS
jgi:trimeric autotransporter adhesin